MADKPQGNILFEIIIAVLAIILIFTILYPQKVWNKEDVQESMCRARMDAILNLELQYNNQVWTYSDSLEKVKDAVFADPRAVSWLDSLVIWDDLVTRDELKTLVDAKTFPQDLRTLIREKLLKGEPIRNLGQYDSLQYRLINTLKAQLEDTSGAQNALLDTNIQWTVLFGERNVENMVDAADLSKPIIRRAISAIQSDTPVEETRAWKTLYPAFYKKLEEIIQTAETSDIWEKKDLDEWKEIKRVEWEADLDTLSIEEQDSLWAQNQRELWDKAKDIVWKRDSNILWKAEKEIWPEENESMWTRIVSQKWESDRKKEWITSTTDDQEKLLSFWLSVQLADTTEMDEEIVDSTLTTIAVDTAFEAKAFFTEKRDSLWRVDLRTIRTLEYEPWLKKNNKFVTEVIENIWQNDRRITWETDAYERWLAEKNEDKSARWVELKEALWITSWSELWKDEEIKLERKNSALRKLDLSVSWAGLLPADQIESLVAGLELPNTAMIWKKLTAKTDEKGSKLYKSGMVALFRDALIEFVNACPVAKVPYLIQVQDTTVIKRVSIKCPISTTHDLSVGEYKYAVIEDTVDVEEDVLIAETMILEESDTTAVLVEEEIEEPVQEEVAPKKSSKSYVVSLRVDPITRDTTKTRLSLPANVKLFGGGTLRNHGNIDEDGKKSWQKKGR
ncbi:hypothetical protein HQ585_09740 [candidate division KSB1 bacterium]|nr:hypothetical protein [candidate division KSB1 bacterium]